MKLLEYTSTAAKDFWQKLHCEVFPYNGIGAETRKLKIRLFLFIYNKVRDVPFTGNEEVAALRWSSMIKPIVTQKKT